jgi:hypothetical protein
MNPILMLGLATARTFKAYETDRKIIRARAGQASVDKGVLDKYKEGL